MKSITFISSVLLAAIVAARPRVQDEPLKDSARITAFVIDDKGNPSVECWDITTELSSTQVSGTNGRKGSAHSLSLTKGNDFEGVDVLTWPISSIIWPPSSGDYSNANFDLSNTFNLFSIQGGLINFNFYAARFGMASGDDDEVENHIFSLENGDDWFYFEDDSSSSARVKATGESYPFHFSTISATETELLRLRYSSRPKHTKVHKGACSFTGINTSGTSSFEQESTSHERSPLTVQVRIEDL